MHCKCYLEAATTYKACWPPAPVPADHDQAAPARSGRRGSSGDFQVFLLRHVSPFQDTHHCPDGWHVSDIGDEIECILLSGLEEKLTKEDAAIICAFHEGWLVDMDEGHGPQKNNLLKSLIAEAEGAGQGGFPGPQ